MKAYSFLKKTTLFNGAYSETLYSQFDDTFNEFYIFSFYKVLVNGLEKRKFVLKYDEPTDGVCYVLSQFGAKY